MEPQNFENATDFANLKAKFKEETGLNFDQDLNLYMQYIVAKKLDGVNNQLYALNENLIKGLSKIRW